MSQKKRKKQKRKVQSVHSRETMADMDRRLQDERKSKRLSPVARNLLFLDLIFLGVTQIMLSYGVISETVGNWTATIGLILILAAMYFQFTFSRDNKLKSTNGPKGPHL